MARTFRAPPLTVRGVEGEERGLKGKTLSSLLLDSVAELSHSGTVASVDDPAPLFVPKIAFPAEFVRAKTAGRLRKAEKLVFGIMCEMVDGGDIDLTATLELAYNIN